LPEAEFCGGIKNKEFLNVRDETRGLPLRLKKGEETIFHGDSTTGDKKSHAIPDISRTDAVDSMKRHELLTVVERQSCFGHAPSLSPTGTLSRFFAFVQNSEMRIARW
jgi:hypothetical protein